MINQTGASDAAQNGRGTLRCTRAKGQTKLAVGSLEEENYNLSQVGSEVIQMQTKQKEDMRPSQDLSLGHWNAFTN